MWSPATARELGRRMPRPATRRAATLVELLRGRAEADGEQRIFSHLRDGGPEAEHLSYAELDARARAIAALLRERGPAGGRYLLLYPPGLEFVAAFFGCLYAGCVPVPAYPPDPARLDRTAPRLRAIAVDAEARAVLSNRAIVDGSGAILGHSLDLGRLDWIVTEEAPPAGGWIPPAIDPASEALLQYTSGSTGTPRGVVVTHANLMHNSALIQECFGHSRRSNGVIWLPCYHDMGLIGGVLQPVYAGFPVKLMSPIDFLKRPVRWLQAISGTPEVTSGGPNFAFDLCVRRTTPAQRERLDLSGWKVAFTGAEPVRAETIERFVEAFGPCGFRREAFLPCYGLAEATLIVSGEPGPRTLAADREQLERGRVTPRTPGDPAAETLVSCGTPRVSGSVEIVDPRTRLACAPGHVGEIWVSSPSVAEGYWRQPDAAAESFGARLADGDERPFLRTGDLGLLREGRLFVRGRLKDLIVIRGRNLAPQDVERDVERAHPALRRGCGAAFAIEADGEERLAIAQETNPELGADPDEVVESIVSAVSDLHGIAVYSLALLAPRTIPKTSSGKIRRRACREALLAGELVTVATWGPVLGGASPAPDPV